MQQEPQSNGARLDYFPVTAFAVILGIGGFTVLLDKLQHIQVLPPWPYWIMAVFTTVLFFTTAALYARKVITAFELVKQDFNHTIRVNFVAAISISLLILSIIYMGCCPFASLTFWYVGTLLHTVIAFSILKRWVNSEFNIHHFNPAWFIPIVGLALIPVAGVEFVPVEVTLFFWANALLFWLIFFTIVLYRIIFHPPIPTKLTPTFFMLIAPPAVLFISYVRITMHFDIVAKALLLMAVFTAILLVFVRHQYAQKAFFMSWWAFTFPLDALAIALTLAYIITRSPLYKASALLISAAAAITVALVTYKTVVGIKAGIICVDEEK